MGYRYTILALLAIALLGGVTLADDKPKAVDAFRAALAAEDVDALESLLPERGRIRVRLDRLGDQKGELRSGQLKAILDRFFERGKIRSVEIESTHRAGSQALARLRTAITTASGRDVTITLHLTLAKEEKRWVVRELREARRSS